MSGSDAGVTCSSRYPTPRAWKRWLGVWLLGASCASSVWFSSRPVAAQDNVVTISEVTIVGRIQKPIAAVDVARIQPQMTLAELHQPFLERIEDAIYRAPF